MKLWFCSTERILCTYSMYIQATLERPPCRYLADQRFTYCLLRIYQVDNYAGTSHCLEDTYWLIDCSFVCLTMLLFYTSYYCCCCWCWSRKLVIIVHVHIHVPSPCYHRRRCTEYSNSYKVCVCVQCAVYTRPRFFSAAEQASSKLQLGLDWRSPFWSLRRRGLERTLDVDVMWCNVMQWSILDWWAALSCGRSRVGWGGKAR